MDNYFNGTISNKLNYVKKSAIIVAALFYIAREFKATNNKNGGIVFMEEHVMHNVRKKLSQSREKCPGLSEEVYALADYMASVASDELTPHKMSMTLMLCIMDVRDGRNGFVDAKTQEFPLYLKEHQEQVLAQAFYFPQLIDDIADADFANEFRSCCKDILQFDPPRREEKVDLYADIGGDYPDYVKVAVNWWADAIQHPQFDNGSGIDGLFAMMMVKPSNSITDSQLIAFKKHLAKLIVKDMKSSIFRIAN